MSRGSKAACIHQGGLVFWDSLLHIPVCMFGYLGLWGDMLGAPQQQRRSCVLSLGSAKPKTSSCSSDCRPVQMQPQQQDHNSSSKSSCCNQDLNNSSSSRSSSMGSKANKGGVAAALAASKR